MQQRRQVCADAARRPFRLKVVLLCPKHRRRERGACYHRLLCRQRYARRPHVRWADALQEQDSLPGVKRSENTASFHAFLLPVKRRARRALRLRTSLCLTVSHLGVVNGSEGMTGSRPIAQSVLNDCPSLYRGSVCMITAFIGRDPTTQVNPFIRSSTDTLITIIDAQLESKLNTEVLIKRGADLHPRVQSTLVEAGSSQGEPRLKVSYQTPPSVTMSLWPAPTFMPERNSISVNANRTVFAKLLMAMPTNLKSFKMANRSTLKLPDSSCFATARLTRRQSCRTFCYTNRT